MLWNKLQISVAIAYLYRPNLKVLDDFKFRVDLLLALYLLIILEEWTRLNQKETQDQYSSYRGAFFSKQKFIGQY